MLSDLIGLSGFNEFDIDFNLTLKLAKGLELMITFGTVLSFHWFHVGMVITGLNSMFNSFSYS